MGFDGGENPSMGEANRKLVRGTLEHVDPQAAGFRERFDPEPWLDDRDAWLMIEPFAITGRALRSAEQLWAYDARAYL